MQLASQKALLDGGIERCVGRAKGADTRDQQGEDRAQLEVARTTVVNGLIADAVLLFGKRKRDKGGSWELLV